jgi:outer membrane protein OmpA-like peptidoglycan-associated protein
MTTKYRYALLMSAAAMFAAPAAYATEPGTYLSIGAGLHLPRDTNAVARTPVGAPPTNFAVEFDKGFLGVIAAGYKWDNSFRTELELGYRQADFDEINGTSALGIQKVLGLSANVLYDFDTGSRLTPYVGGGLGVSSNKWKRAVTNGSPLLDSRTRALQWQGIAGLSMNVSERVEAFADYRYISAGKNRYRSSPPGTVVADSKDRSHNILLGVRFSLSAPQPAAVAEAPAPAPMAAAPPPLPEAAPPPPPVPQKFLVFFDFDRANLRADAQRIVGEAADYARKTGKARITATGHADTSGSPAYNLALSERRGHAVMAALKTLGFSTDEIVVVYKGESEPLVSTGDGVKEAQNRRVEIILD